MNKDQIIRLIDIGKRLELKVDQSHEFLEYGYWYSESSESIEKLLMDVLGIPEGFDRDNFFGLFEVYSGDMTADDFIQKAELISDQSIKPTTNEIVQRLMGFSEYLQDRVEVLEKMLDAKINLLDGIIKDLDDFARKL